MTLALAIWLWVVTECARPLIQLIRPARPRPPVWTPKRALLAGALALATGIAIARQLHQPEAERTALPCIGDGVDYDIRDGLCYKHVPLKFQRR